MEDLQYTINLGKPSEITAEELHYNLKQLPANTYLELYYIMRAIIEHTLEGRITND